MPALEEGRRVERSPLNAYAGAVRPGRRATLALFSFGPAYLRHARCRRCSSVSRSVEAAVPYRIEVTPGNATVPKGADQAITREAAGFDAEQPVLMVRKSADAGRSSACR